MADERESYGAPNKHGDLTIYGSVLPSTSKEPSQSSISYISVGDLKNHLLDGDTYTHNGVGQRFAIFDAPEKDQEWGDFAKGEVMDILGKAPMSAKLKVVSYGKDKYNRDLVDVFLPDGEPLSRKLLKRGVAVGTLNKNKDTEELLQKVIDYKIGMFNPNHPLTNKELRTPYVHRQIGKGKNFLEIPDLIDGSPQAQAAYVKGKRQAFEDYKKNSYDGSIYDQFVQMGLNPNYSFRKEVFHKLGYKDYKGTAAQNTLLLADVRKGKLSKDQLINSIMKTGGFIPTSYKSGGMVQVNGKTGEMETHLEGGERIFSRKHTKEIVAHVATATEPQHLKELGRKVCAMIKEQDNRQPQYTTK